MADAEESPGAAEPSVLRGQQCAAQALFCLGYADDLLDIVEKDKDFKKHQDAFEDYRAFRGRHRDVFNGMATKVWVSPPHIAFRSRILVVPARAWQLVGVLHVTVLLSGCQ